MNISRPVLYSGICIVFIVAIPFLSLLIPGISCELEYGNGITTQEATGLSHDQIAQKLAEHWLDKHSSFFSCPSLRLTEYKINSVHTTDTPGTSEFISEVNLDAKKPQFFGGKGWETGNALIEKDGWIRNVTHFMTIKSNAQTYYIDKLDPLP